MPKSPPKFLRQKKKPPTPKQGFWDKVWAEMEKRSVAKLVGGVFLVLGILMALLMNSFNLGNVAREWIPGIPEEPGTDDFLIEGIITDLYDEPLANLRVVIAEYEGPGDLTDDTGYFSINPELPKERNKITLLILTLEGEQIYATDFALIKNELSPKEVQRIRLPEDVIAHLDT